MSADQPNSFASDSSFVILGQGSLPFDLADASMMPIRTMQSFNENLTRASSTCVSETDPKDIQTKLDQLLKENYQLKETLNQNNLAMKTQFDTLTVWQQEVFKTHQTHKEKFMETKELVLKLRAENAGLRKQMEEGMPKNGPEEVLSKNMGELTESLKSEVKTLEDKCQHVQGQLDRYIVMYREVEMQNQELQKENVKYKEATSGGDAGLQISSLLKLIEKERSETARLKEQVSIGLKDSVLNPSWMQVNGESMRVESDLRKEIVLLTTQLKEKQESEESNKLTLQVVQKQYEKLFKDYEALQRDWSQFNQEKITKEKIVEDAVKQVKEIEELLKKKETENEVLRKELTKLNLSCEENGLLRAQVELYQSDFNAEREAREKLVSERSELEENVRLLKRRVADFEGRNQQQPSSSLATNRVESAVEAVISQSPAPDSRTSNQRTEEDPPAVATNDNEVLKPFSCFKCEERFRELRQLQDHVEECLELTN